jgi:hypothetical protein
MEPVSARTLGGKYATSAAVAMARNGVATRFHLRIERRCFNVILPVSVSPLSDVYVSCGLGRFAVQSHASAAEGDDAG